MKPRNCNVILLIYDMVLTVLESPKSPMALLAIEYNLSL